MENLYKVLNEQESLGVLLPISPEDEVRRLRLQDSLYKKLKLPNGIKVVVPIGSFGPSENPHSIDEGLRILTQAIVLKMGKVRTGGFLGGEWGYGTDYKNDTFMMHSYCWCENDTCSWCVGCSCPETAFHYYIDGQEVPFTEWRDYYTNRVSSVSDPNWERASSEVNKHRTSSSDRICTFCRGENTELFGGPNQLGLAAPNFYHKPSGLRVWW